MGLHTGEAQTQDGDYVSSLTLVRTQRVTAAGHGGQTLLSSAMADAVRSHLPDGTTLRELGAFKLRGLADAEIIFELVAADLPSEFPALKVEDTEALPSGALDELVRGKLVGRGAELAQLKRHWEQAQQARGHLVLVSGEPGVGKTRLARELIAQAQASGATILRGGCYEFEATTPYLPFVEAIREWVHRQTPAQLRGASGRPPPRSPSSRRRSRPSSGRFRPTRRCRPNDERMRLFDNVARFLQSLAAARGLLVFTDDIHWADQGTLSLLLYLLRSMQGDRVLFLAPYREIELDRAHPLAAALVEWNRERLATRVALGRLSRADTNALLATLFGQETRVRGVRRRASPRDRGQSVLRRGGREVADRAGPDLPRGRRLGPHERAGARDPAERERGDRPAPRPAVRGRRGHAAHGRGARQDLRLQRAGGGLRTGEDALLDALDEGSAAQLIRAVDGSERSRSPTTRSAKCSTRR